MLKPLCKKKSNKIISSLPFSYRTVEARKTQPKEHPCRAKERQFYCLGRVTHNNILTKLKTFTQVSNNITLLEATPCGVTLVPCHQ
jgi:hypothetical protein